ncbi:MAG: cell wall metabolism sensor histidine kinase WalK [Clostridia bacterium]|nr:cell wall metabolism sensor histidine kinase WalK [Clostridia bacterium]
MKSIKTRLSVYFILIIVITVFVMEIILINIIKQNYYKNLEIILTNQVRYVCNNYHDFYSNTSLNDIVLNDIDTFWHKSTAQVELIDMGGNVLMDNIGVVKGNVADLEDVKNALKGETGIWIGKVEYTDEKVMAVSEPLRSGDKMVGVLRVITSLSKVNREIQKIAFVFIGVGLGVILLSVIISFFIAATIVNPIKDVTRVAEKMARGNFYILSRKKHDDEIGKLSDTLNYMAEEIQKKDQLKNEFISSVSHELRTPLTSIKGWSITLKEGYLQDREMLKDGLEIIETESDRLTTMVEELLDFSKFVSGKIALKKEKVDAVKVMEHIKKQLMPRAQRENIHFQIEYEKDIPHLISDQNRLKQLFINIIDNSFKFTPSGGKVTFSASIREENLIFSIKDTGTGIAKDELPRVKEKFYKGKSSKSQNGIGLSICDEIVKLMGGNMEISSEIDKGTEVFVTLPITGEGAS